MARRLKERKPRGFQKSLLRMQMKPGDEIELHVFGDVFHVRATGNSHVGGSLQIYGGALNSKKRLAFGTSNGVIVLGTASVVYADKVSDNVPVLKEGY